MNRLKKIREERQESLKEVSEALNIPYQTYRNYEIGKREPKDKEVWNKISEYFNVSVAYLMGISDSKNELSNEDIEDIIKATDNIPENFNIKHADLEIIGAYQTIIKNSNNSHIRFFLKLIDKKNNAFVYTVIHGIFLTEEVQYKFKTNIAELFIHAQFLIPDRYEAINNVVQYNHLIPSFKDIFDKKNYDQYIFRGFLNRQSNDDYIINIYKQICEYTLNLYDSSLNNLQFSNKKMINKFRINSLNEIYLDLDIEFSK